MCTHPLPSVANVVLVRSLHLELKLSPVACIYLKSDQHKIQIMYIFQIASIAVVHQYIYRLITQIQIMDICDFSQNMSATARKALARND